MSSPQTVQVPPALRTERDCYVLQVRGDSMIDEGILDGDWVVIERRDHARNGEIVVALVDGGEATLKRIEQRPTLAYILVNRDGAALQPGSRTYARSWIRDGAFSSAALLELACPDSVREYLRWFAPHQFANGMESCCIDQRGADPVPEHDSAGEFLFTAAEYCRYTRDVGFIHDLWPSLVRAVDYLDTLRRTRTTAAYERPDKQAYFGLLPESISHEGYASHPVHSYWDDFFALRGLKDAAHLAVVMGVKPVLYR